MQPFYYWGIQFNCDFFQNGVRIVETFIYVSCLNTINFTSSQNIDSRRNILVRANKNQLSFFELVHSCHQSFI